LAGLGLQAILAGKKAKKLLAAAVGSARTGLDSKKNRRALENCVRRAAQHKSGQIIGVALFDWRRICYFLKVITGPNVPFCVDHSSLPPHGYRNAATDIGSFFVFPLEAPSGFWSVLSVLTFIAAS
jgi:hypothetical protein